MRRHRYKRKLTIFAAPVLGAALALGVSCGKPTVSTKNCVGAKCEDTSVGNHTWVVDMSKAGQPTSQGGYGKSGKYFWGLHMEEIDSLKGLSGLLTKLDEAATAHFAQKFQSMGAPQLAPAQATFKIIWDQVMNVVPGEASLIFNSKEQAYAAVNALNQAGKTYSVVVKTADGQWVAAPGRMKVIPMLKDTAPNKQVYIKGLMKNGDVISYVHPEQTTLDSLMERRASHVAMHYTMDTDADGEADIVHHIDNPNGYGPQYNHAPRRHMPFHAFRFAPGADAKFGPQQLTVDDPSLYATAARNWAVMDNDLSPFAGFFDLQLQTSSDVPNFAQSALSGEEIPNVYCSGLAYTNLNLGLNFPQNAVGLTGQYTHQVFVSPMPTTAEAAWNDTFQAFTQRSWYFSDADGDIAGQQFAAPDQLKPLGQLVFPPYTATDMLNVWIQDTFKNVPVSIASFIEDKTQLPQMIAGVAQQISGSVPAGKEQEVATGLVMQTRDTMIQMIITTPDFAKNMVGAFRQLEWSDSDGGNAPGSSSMSGGTMPVASQLNAATWAQAWAYTAQAKGKALAALTLEQRQDDAVVAQAVGRALRQAKSAFEQDQSVYVTTVLSGTCSSDCGGEAVCEDSACAAEHVCHAQSGACVMQIQKAAYKREAQERGVDFNVLSKIGSPVDLLEYLGQKMVKNRFVPPRIWLDKVEDEKIAISRSSNRLSLDDGQGLTEQKVMAYVGTVINCELLAAADADADACAASSTERADNYAEGGADTHTYPHYAVGNGGQRTHRRIDATPGPEKFGKGTTFTVRFTTSNVDQVRFLVHVPDHFKSAETAGDAAGTIDPNSPHFSLSGYDRYCNERNPAGQSCAPKTGILLNPVARLQAMVDAGEYSYRVAGHVYNQEIKFNLLEGPAAPCTIKNENTLSCDLADQIVENGVTKLVNIRKGDVSRDSQGFFVATMVNTQHASSESEVDWRKNEFDARGVNYSDPAGPDFFASALTGANEQPGSAHFDVWHVSVWNRQ